METQNPSVRSGSRADNRRGLSSFLKLSDDPVCIVDSAGMLLEFNARSSEIFGWSSVDHDLHLLLHGVNGQTNCRANCALRKCLKQTIGRHLPDEVVRGTDGLPFRVEVWTSPWKSGGSESGLVVHFRKRSVSEHETSAPRQSPLENGLDGWFRANKAGRYLSINTPFAEIYGYRSARELLAEIDRIDHVRSLQPDRRHELLQTLDNVGSISQFESQILRRDGTIAWIAETARFTGGEDGSEIMIEGTVQDITWRKLAEDVLRQAEEKWRALVESSGECIVITDKSGVVSFANGNAHKAGLGVTRDNIFANLGQVSQQALAKCIDRVFLSKIAEVIDLQRVQSSGPALWFETRVVPIEHAGAIQRVILIATDVTKRRQAEDAIRESRRFIERVADTSPAILYVYDVIRGRYVYVNHQVTKILGYSSDEFISGGSRLASELIHPDDAGLLLERERRLAIEENDGVVFECVFRMKDAHQQWLWIRTRDVIFTRNAEGRPEQIIGMAEDVTERRRSRQELEHSREQLRALSSRLHEAREEERAAISRRVHDELGQALTALNWDVTWLQDHFAKIDGLALTDARERMDSMTGLIHSMIQTVRKVAYELRPPILDHFGLLAAIEWQAKEFKSRFGIPCEVSARGHVNAPNRDVSTGVFRIFQEILTNVARHAAASRVHVELTENPEGLSLIVHDNGRGIKEGQSHDSLGILGMRERALMFGGSVGIASASGKGTTVTVSIPMSGCAAAGGPRKETLRQLRRIK